MNLREIEPYDIDVLVEMYYDLIGYAYPNRERKSIDKYYKAVQEWYEQPGLNRVRIVEKDDVPVGFSLATYVNAGGLTEIYINAEVTYVKEEYRNTKAAFLLYNDVYRFAQDEEMGIESTSTPASSPIVQKRWGANHMFNHFEVTKEQIRNSKKI